MFSVKKIVQIGLQYYISMYKTTKEMIDKLQQLRCKMTLKIYENICNYLDDRISCRQGGYFHFEEDRCSKGAQSKTENMQEVFSSMKII